MFHSMFMSKPASVPVAPVKPEPVKPLVVANCYAG
jgi:hypothetical protein